MNCKTKIFNKLMGKMAIGMMPIEYVEKISEEMCDLFREIAKEALPNEIPKKANDGGIFEQEKRGYINGFNNARSEILSNIEKVI